jgi:ubiquinone/menaquinone biosynthesis C-methylase UbiE
MYLLTFQRVSARNDNMQELDHHDDVIRREFTRQAEAYAANPSITDRERVARLVEAVGPTSQDRVLEVATGPGYVAMAFAVFAQEVVGVDLTAAPLAIAEKMRQQHGLTNLRFELANANRLPFDDAAFDVVVCRFAFHHFVTPRHVLGEMVRACRPQGKVVVEDLMASEHPQRAAYHNRIETLRDPSHTAGLSLSQLLHMAADAGLEVETVQSHQLLQEAEQWMQNAQTPAEQAQQVRQLLEQDEARDLSGLTPFRNEQGQLCFTQRTAIVVGRKLHA